MGVWKNLWKGSSLWDFNPNRGRVSSFPTNSTNVANKSSSSSIKNIWNKAKSLWNFNPSSKNKQINKTDEIIKKNEEAENAFNKKNDRGKSVFVARPISWAPDIHNGHEPSSLVSEIDYDGKGNLRVKYTTGPHTYLYTDIDYNDVLDFVKDESKGRWALAHLWNIPYLVVD